MAGPYVYAVIEALAMIGCRHGTKISIQCEQHQNSSFSYCICLGGSKELAVLYESNSTAAFVLQHGFVLYK